ncbi:transposase [Sinorhizobium meliloti]|nr:transposase [Sinorhizobium meliloti]MCO5966164.1 transposase [Sinorhizobium meliloti]
MTHHPHLHCLVPGGVLSADGGRWIACRRRRFFLPVRVLSRLFCRLFLERWRRHRRPSPALLRRPCVAWRRQCLGAGAASSAQEALGRLCQAAVGSPEQVLSYLGRYPHRVAIANSRLISAGDTGVTFRWRDYHHGNAPRSMTLAPHEFIRRFPASLACPTVSTASAISASSPTASAAPGSQSSGDCWPMPRRNAAGHQRAPFDRTVCPCCGGILRITARLPPARPWPDTS